MKLLFRTARTRAISFFLGATILYGVAETARAQTNAFITITNTTALVDATNYPVPTSSGAVYVLEKFSPGQLTLSGQFSGGAGSILRTTTQTSGDTTTVFELAADNSAYSGAIQTFRGSVQVDSATSLGTGTIYGDGNNGAAGDLLFNAGMTLANPLVIQSATSINTGANTVTMNGPVSGAGGLTKYGAGTLNLNGAISYTGVTTVNAGTLTVGTVSLLAGTTISITAGAVVQSSGTLNLDAASSPQLNGVSGAGTLRLTSTANSATSPDIYFNANDVVQGNSTANDGTEISSTVDLGTVQRYIYGLTDHNGVGKYGASSGADCTFAGPITDSGGMTFIAQDNYTGSNPMECPFYLTAANTFTGPVEIQRGSVYLGNASALTAGNILRFNPASGNNARFFLYGNNASVTDLQSANAGTSLIADGNLKPGNVGPSTLTITQNNPFTFSGTINDIQSEYNATTGLTLTPTLSIVKNGAAALTIAGACTYSGSTTVNAGALYINAASSGGGAVTVANGATFGGYGTISSAVSIPKGATLEAGGGSGVETLSLKSLSLGTAATDTMTINCDATQAGGVAHVAVTTASGITNNGMVTININGTFPNTVPATYTLISYAGTIKGSGSFVLGTLADQGMGYLSNNTTALAIQLVITNVVIPSITWVGAPLNNWDLLGGNEWKQTGTSTPAPFTNGSITIFDDSAANFLVNIATTVTPGSLVLSNSINNYIFSGPGSIAGNGLTMAGNGTLTISNVNTYAGNTVINAGKVVLGAVAAIPTSPGTVIVNGTLDLGGFSPTYNNLSGTGVVDNVTAGGAPLLTLSDTANPTFAGTIQNTSGAVGLYVAGTGTLTLSGVNNYSGGTAIGSLSAGGGTLTVGINNALPVGSALTMDNRTGTSVLNLGAFNQNLGAITLYAGSSDRTIETGTGTLILSGDLTLVDPHVSGGGQDYTLAFASPINLTGTTRTFTVGYGNNAESSDFGDLHLNGVISGSAGLTLAPWSSSGTTYYGSVSFGAANTYTGPTSLTGATSSSTGTSTLALNVNNSFPNNSAFIQSAGTILDLTTWGKNTGITTGMGSLTGSGTITLGSAGVLTIGYDNTSPPAYSGSIGGAGGAIVKTGTGTLSLSGANTFTGTVKVNGGKLYVNGTNSGGGAVTVASGATLGGNGLVSSPVSVANGGTVEAGAAMGAGTLTVNSLGLGASVSDNITLNCDASPAGVDSLSVLNANGLTNNATVTVNITGVFPAVSPVVYTLVTYSGTIHGSGTFVLGTMPDSAIAYLTNNTSASAIQLVVSSVTIPSVTWNGAPTSSWDLLGETIWKVSGTSTPTAYADGDQTFFDDTAANFTVNLAASVNPNGVTISNSVNNYSINGTGSISGYTSLTKTGSATLTLASANSYFGPTTIAAGTLTLGNAAAIPGGSGAGNVTVNGTLDINGFSPTLNNLSGSGMVDDLTAAGSPTLTASNATASTFAGSIQNTSGALALVKTGSGTLSLSGSNSFSGVTTISGGILQLGAGGAGGTLGAGNVNDGATLAFNRSDSNTFPNNVFGAGGLQQNGTGTTTVSGNLTYTGPTVVNAGTLVFPGNVTFDAGTGSTLTVAANAAMQSGFVLSLNANSSSTAIDISGAGTVQLVSTIDRIESFPDLFVGANNDGVTTANYGIRFASGLNLGSVQRLVWAISGEDDVTRNGLTGADCQFAGPISGTAELSLLGKNSWQGVNTMEEAFAFNASNSWTGILEVLRGSVYLGNANALTRSNVLILDPAASVNSRLFLYGFSASISDLQTGGYGNALIADGNNMSSSNVGPATLTVTENNPTLFAGNIVDWYTEFTAPATGAMLPTLGLIKSGPAALTLTGSNTYSGTTVINAGKLYMNGTATGGGAVTVNSGGVLAGNGLIASAVTIKNGGAIETGGGTANGNFTLKSLALGSVATDISTLNLASSAVLVVTNNNGFTITSGVHTVTINVGGNIGSLGATPLITYVGTFGGTGFNAFQLGATPSGVAGYLSNDTVHASIDFVATLVTIPRWTGAASTEWSTNVITLPKNWVLDSDGVTAIDYADGENVKFDDTAASGTVSISVANVSPLSVLFNNSALNYAVSGAYGIIGPASLTKQGSALVTLAISNSYSGATTISAGTLALGTTGAIPGGTGAGNVTVNGTLNLAGFSPTLNNLSGSGIVDNLTGVGSPLLTIDSTANSTFAGAVKNTTGTLGLTLIGVNTLTLTGSNTYTGPTVVSGITTLLVNGSLSSGGVSVQNGTALGGSGKISGPVAMSAGSALDLAANSPLSVGSLTLNGNVTVNVSGSVSSSNTATYVLLNHTAISGASSFLLAPVAGFSGSGYTATLNDTNNQLLLMVAPTKPTGTIADVRHVVIFMQENRSFDHYFGSLHGVHGYSDHVMLTFQNGNSDLYQPNGSSYELPFHTSTTCLSDLAHDWGSTHSAWNSGNWNQWVAQKGTETMAYYNRSDLQYYYSLADNFTICDEYHCSTMTSTDPNRLHLWTGMLDPNDTGGGPVIDNTEPANGWGTNWVTYPQFLQKAGVSWKVYQASDNYDDNALYWFAAFKNAAAGTPLYANGVSFVPSIYSGSGFPADYSNLVAGFKADVSNNTLPSVSWIVGPDVGSEHPSWSPGDGEILTKGLLDALASNPTVYNSTVFILNYDENDGFFDHGVPITPPTGTSSEFVSGLPIGLGVRVPCIIVSPWSRGGYVCSQVFDHTSVIRFLEKWTGVQCPNISAWRRQVCGDLTSALDFAHPNTNYPVFAAAIENDCPSGTTASPPGQQTVPVQESGTLLERPLPYQPNASSLTDCGSGLFTINLTNSGTASVHYSIYPNAYRTDGPWPYDVASSNLTSVPFNAAAYTNRYDFSCYGPNGFLRRFAGNLSADCGQIEAASYLNPYASGLEVALANPSASPVIFSVTNGYYSNSLVTYTVPAMSTNLIVVDASTNGGWYDVTATASSDSLFMRRFAGHIETNAMPAALASSENPSGYKDNVTFTANLTGFGVPTGSVQFETNGVDFGAPVTLVNGSASISNSLLPRASILVSAVYSGDSLNQPSTNSLIQIVTNHPPVAAAAFYSRANNISLKIAIGGLLTNATDADGDPLSLIGAGTDGMNLLTTNGATIFTNSSYIFYTNSVTPNVNDSFEYTVSDGQGGTGVGTVSILMNNNVLGQANVNLNITSTNVVANFFGIPGFKYTVQRSTNLTVGLGWLPISTNTAPADGLIQVTDSFGDLGIPIPPIPSPVFYRLQYNP